MYQYKLKNNISILNYELKALQNTGIVFKTFTQHNNEIILADPTISKGFLLENKITNEPTLLFNANSFQIALFEDFEYVEISKNIFLENMQKLNPNFNKDSAFLETLFQMEVQRLKRNQNKFQEEFLANINTRLLRIKEAMDNGKC